MRPTETAMPLSCLSSTLPTQTPQLVTDFLPPWICPFWTFHQMESCNTYFTYHSA